MSRLACNQACLLAACAGCKMMNCSKQSLATFVIKLFCVEKVKMSMKSYLHLLFQNNFVTLYFFFLIRLPDILNSLLTRDSQHPYHLKVVVVFVVIDCLPDNLNSLLTRDSQHPYHLKVVVVFVVIDYACYRSYPGDNDPLGNCPCQGQNEQSYWRGEYLSVAALHKFGTHFFLDETLEHLNPHWVF